MNCNYCKKKHDEKEIRLHYLDLSEYIFKRDKKLFDALAEV